MNNLNNSQLASGVGVTIILVAVLVAFLVMLVPMVFYILTLQKALNRCSPENRAMEPAMAWLLLIPCFSLVWNFFVVLKMSKSLAAEFQKRGIQEEPEPGKVIGLVMAGLFCASVIPLLNYLAGPAGLVCWIIYWIKIAGFSKKLEA